ncbi:MarR family winged helix-turn-helix transcriptional regulator [Sphingobium sp. CCH11-B1]|uniref:MarR family winged helix-turn-helix transcriptional regulator n=1 Tax=Sphingobium sp. CCH11-B1 TaxID=1768781 RepID=UPI0008325E0A|nr:MarR family transcriptional regulator [Sphingobium sp. CCH11-B1]
MAKSPALSFLAFTTSLQPVRRVWIQAVTLVAANFDVPVPISSAVIMVTRAGEDGIRQGTLAEEVGVNHGAMVRIVDQAEAAGYLERRGYGQDRRIRIIHATDKGRELGARLEEEFVRLRKSLLADIPLEEIETATRVLRLFEKRITGFLQSGEAER